MIKIVDYGLGNIQAFLNVYKSHNIPASIAKTASELESATRIILPGVGSFDHAMQLLDESGMRDTLNDFVLSRRIPILGICVGMQMLARCSEEGTSEGLGWIPGVVRKLKNNNDHELLRLPHMGWNSVEQVMSHRLFAGLNDNSHFYFLHSYYFECDNHNSTLAKANYGSHFACVVNNENIFGVQFHPEKSHHSGALLLKNFAEM